MTHLKAAIEIDAPRDHVFALAGDLTRWPEWTTFVKEVEITSGDGKSAGSTDEMVIRMFLRPIDFEGTIGEFKPGETVAREFTGFFTGDERLTFASVENGTRVEWSVDYTPPFGIIGKFGAWVFTARAYLNALEDSLERLKSALEA